MFRKLIKLLQIWYMQPFHISPAHLNMYTTKTRLMDHIDSTHMYETNRIAWYIWEKGREAEAFL